MDKAGLFKCFQSTGLGIPTNPELPEKLGGQRDDRFAGQGSLVRLGLEDRRQLQSPASLSVLSEIFRTNVSVIGEVDLSGLLFLGCVLD